MDKVKRVNISVNESTKASFMDIQESERVGAKRPSADEMLLKLIEIYQEKNK
jgi:hypothetical protein